MSNCKNKMENEPHVNPSDERTVCLGIMSRKWHVEDLKWLNGRIYRSYLTYVTQSAPMSRLPIFQYRLRVQVSGIGSLSSRVLVCTCTILVTCSTCTLVPKSYTKYATCTSNVESIPKE